MSRVEAGEKSNVVQSGEYLKRDGDPNNHGLRYPNNIWKTQDCLVRNCKISTQEAELILILQVFSIPPKPGRVSSEAIDIRLRQSENNNF